MPAPAPTDTTAGYTAGLVAERLGAGADAELAYDIRRDGAPVDDLEPYLGADGHLVALREGDLAFLHVHPEESSTPGRIRFGASLPSAGRYRLFLQFKHDGVVRTVAHTVEVPRVSRATSQDPERLELPIEGMTCASCAARVEKRLNRLEGVNATVNYATETASVSFDPGSVEPERLVEAVERAGYGARLPVADGEAAAEEPEERDPTAPLRRRLVVSAALSLPVLLMSMIPALQFDNWQWLALQLATPVVLWGGWPFHRAAWTNLRHGAATMDTLISVGTLAAWGWSLVALFFLGAGDPGMRMGFDLVIDPGAGADHIYLEVAAVVTTFLLAGRYFEVRAKRRAGAALPRCSSSAPRRRRVLDDDGSERRVAISELAVGDRFVVRPGERIATDGVVEVGSSAVDASLLTGESVPVEVGPGDEVTGATINAGGRLVVRATRVGSDTALAQIGRLVTRAQSGKAPVQRLADRISAVFVPIVIALSAGTLGFWLADGAGATFAFTAAVAVLIVACPCALGLATPTALLVGTGRGAQLGILITGPEVLESTRRVDTVVLDKTGTVTSGEMSLVTIVLAEGAQRADVLRLAGALEDGSEHPIARAIAAAARDELGQLPAPEGFANREGLGVEGVVEGHGVVVGRPALIADWGLSLNGDARLGPRDGPGRRSHRGRRRMGRPGARAAGRRGHDQADQRRGRRAPARSGPAPGSPHRRRRGDGALGRGGGRHRRGDRRGAAVREGRRRPAPAGRGAGGRHGGRRRQRRARARPGRPRPGDRHRDRPRDRGLRPDARLGRPARGRRCDPPLAPHPRHHQGQPLLGVRLQRGGAAAGGARIPQPDRRGGGDGAVERLRRLQLAPPARLPGAALVGRFVHPLAARRHRAFAKVGWPALASR